ELLARVRAVLRRPGPRERFEEFAFGDVRVRPRGRQVFKAGHEVRLTRKEFDLLVFLIAHRGEVITRERLLDEVWGYERFPTARQPLAATRNAAFSLNESATKVEAATTYNNFYEFGVNKDDPSRLGHTLRPRPWAVQVDGFVQKPKTFDIDELTRLFPLEERVYSLRCVEAWSMVIPWIGFPLASLLKRVEPTGQAKFVEFTTLLDPNQFPAQKPGFFGFSSLDWPYVEGLRLDEAMHPLTLLTVGMYGKVLP